jgi:hypothetical protein
MNFFYHLENPIQIAKEKSLKEKQIDLLFTKKVHVVAKETRVITVYSFVSQMFRLLLSRSRQSIPDKKADASIENDFFV